MATTTPNPESEWSDQKRKLQEKFATLTDADLQYEEGKKNLMFTKLQIKLGITRDELNDIISSD